MKLLAIVCGGLCAACCVATCALLTVVALFTLAF